MRLVTNADSMDVELFERTVGICPDVASRMSEAVGASDPSGDLLRDGFASLVKHAPRLKKDVPASRRINARIVQEAMGLDEYDRLRTWTRGDPVAALGGLRSMLENFSLPDDVEREQKAVEDAAADVEKFLEGGAGDLTRERLDTLKQSLEAAAERLDAALDGATHDIRQQVRAGLAEAADKAEATQHAARALGWGSEEGGLITVPLKERAELAGLLERQPKLVEIMRLAGRLIVEAARRQRSKPDQQSSEVSGITEGGDLPYVTPSEWALLADAETEDQFYRRFSEAGLQQYELTARTEETQGPVLVGLDVSGSMQGYPDIWSKAVALAMYSIARRQNRAFGLYVFNTQVVDRIMIERGDRQPERLARLLSIGSSGGTAFDPVLSEMLEQVEEDRKSDMLLVTDGLCRLPDDMRAVFLERKSASGSKLLSIRIGAAAKLGLGAEAAAAALLSRLEWWADGVDELSQISDRVVNLAGDIINNERDATAAVFSI